MILLLEPITHSMSLPTATRIDELHARTNVALAQVESDGESWATSVRQVVEAEPEAMRALDITQDRLERIRYDENSGKIIIPVGRRDEDAVRAILRALDNTTDLGEGSGEYELRGFHFVNEGRR